VNARFTSSAEAELEEAIAFYAAAENGLGTRFLDEVEAVVARRTACTRLSHNPRRLVQILELRPFHDQWRFIMARRSGVG
jgi:hypothetical protein